MDVEIQILRVARASEEEPEIASPFYGKETRIELAPELGEKEEMKELDGRARGHELILSNCNTSVEITTY
jgi:hypothetical protein